jgi:hypothetical protein
MVVTLSYSEMTGNMLFIINNFFNFIEADDKQQTGSF